jgi:peptide deformylase
MVKKAPKTAKNKGIIPPIVQYEAPVLRGAAKEVPIEDIKSARIQTILSQMKAALVKEHDGVGLAAPQIGVPLRIFIVSNSIFKRTEPDDAAEAAEDTQSPESKTAERIAAGHLVFINPVITKLSREKRDMEEGCLSVRPLYGSVKRSVRASVRAYDEHGRLFERGGSGLLAQIFQHEVDHLQGVLFIDKAKDVHVMQDSSDEDTADA